MSKQYWDFSYSEGRNFSVESTIYATEDEIDAKVGKTVYWSGLGGKHSEGEFVLTKEMFKPAEIVEHGFNPLDEIEQYEDELDDDGKLPPYVPPAPSQAELDIQEMRLRYPESHYDLCNKLPNAEAKNQAEEKLYDDLKLIFNKYADTDLDRYFKGKSIILGVYYKYGEHKGREEEFVEIANSLPRESMTVKEKYTMRTMKSYMQYSSISRLLV